MIRSKSVCNVDANEPSSPNRSFCSDNSKMNNREQTNIRVPGGPKLWTLIKILCGLGLVIIFIDYAISNEAVLPEHRRQPIPIEDQITVVMNTFKRNDMMIGNLYVSFYGCL